MQRTSLNHEQYSKNGFSKYEPRSEKKDSPTKIKDPSSYLPPQTRFKHGEVPYERPQDCQITLIASNVRPDINGKDVKRKLANMGYVLIDYKFKHDLLTNQTFGSGIMHIRAKSDAELRQICEAISSMGMSVEVSKEFLPLNR